MSYKTGVLCLVKTLLLPSSTSLHTWCVGVIAEGEPGIHLDSPLSWQFHSPLPPRAPSRRTPAMDPRYQSQSQSPTLADSTGRSFLTGFPHPVLPHRLPSYCPSSQLPSYCPSSPASLILSFQAPRVLAPGQLQVSARECKLPWKQPPDPRASHKAAITLLLSEFSEPPNMDNKGSN